MSIINKSKTSMSQGNLEMEQEELLIPTKFFSKKEIKKEEEYYQYEKLKHNLKKKITETIIDKLSKILKENESKKDIHVLSSFKTKSDSKGLYQRLKKINKRINEPHKLKACFINWFYKTPNAVEKRKRNRISKNDRNSKIINDFYHYQNQHAPNVVKKTTDMTTKKKANLSTRTKKIGEKPKYKYNYSSNNSNVFYNTEYAGNDPNKGNIYIGKKNGDASYYYQNNYNNFGSLTIIQHNIDNTKKNYNKNIRDMDFTRPTNRSQEKKNELTVGSKSLRNSNNSSMIFLNSYGGSRYSRAQRSEDNRDNEELRELPIDRQNKKIWTVTKEIFECKEVF